MRVTSTVWECITYLTHLLSFSGLHSPGDQQPLPAAIDRPQNVIHDDPGYPIFKPPGGRPNFRYSEFRCEYPDMPDWEFCSSPTERSCWLRHRDGKKPPYNIDTNYEVDAPKGIDRYYELEVNDGTWNADGLIANDTKLVNNQYPGPWIQACWGDRIIVKVTNKLKFNGTAIHWHGIRQNFTMHMDGVPGITQCPIAPGDHFIYNFSAIQYGSSWYHSHYSVQYADGMLGPMTIHGPTTDNFDEPKLPLLMTDWFHNSAFAVIHDTVPGYPTILLNGTGDITKWNYSIKTDTKPPSKYQLHFEKQSLDPPRRARKYLLRLINTSFTTGFVFSIDHHLLTIVSADFVPIVPYTRSHIFIGIGQRYNVIVEAAPIAYGKGLDKNGNYWIRTTVASCFKDKVIGLNGYDRNGILRYELDGTLDPDTEPWTDIPSPPPCRDEEARDMEPWIPWEVKPPSNGKGLAWGEQFDATLNITGGSEDFPLAKWSLEKDNLPAWNPLQINYSNPMFLNLDNLEKSGHFIDWSKSWVVVPENYTENDWVFLGLAGAGGSSFAAHPIHLHGHDFAILQSEVGKPLNSANFKPNLHHPPRRDVVLLPATGFVVIAFKADNPGSWIMHCHIAFHASEGLALQILERQSDANDFWQKPNSPAIKEAQRVCGKWNAWYNDCRNRWPGWNDTLKCYPACSPNKCPKPTFLPFMDDSGI